MSEKTYMQKLYEQDEQRERERQHLEFENDKNYYFVMRWGSRLLVLVWVLLIIILTYALVRAIQTGF